MNLAIFFFFFFFLHILVCVWLFCFFKRAAFFHQHYLACQPFSVKIKHNPCHNFVSWSPCHHCVTVITIIISSIIIFGHCCWLCDCKSKIGLPCPSTTMACPWVHPDCIYPPISHQQLK